MSYVPKGCDQQGRLDPGWPARRVDAPEAAHAASELDDYEVNQWTIEDTTFVVLAVCCGALLALLVLSGVLT